MSKMMDEATKDLRERKEKFMEEHKKEEIAIEIAYMIYSKITSIDERVNVCISEKQVIINGVSYDRPNVSADKVNKLFGDATYSVKNKNYDRETKCYTFDVSFK